MTCNTTPVSDVTLAINARSGDASALDELMERRNWLFYKIAAQFAGGDDWLMEDLSQEARLAFMRAVLDKDKVAEEKLFSHYCYTVMVNDCLRYVNNTHGPLRMSDRGTKEILAISRARRDLADALGRDATDEELAARLGMTLSVVEKRSQQYLCDDISIYEETERLPDALIDHSTQAEIDRWLRREVLKSLLLKLPDNHRKVVMRRVGWDRKEPQTHEEIAYDLGVSRVTTHSWEKQGIARLREMVGLEACDV